MVMSYRALTRPRDEIADMTVTTERRRSPRARRLLSARLSFNHHWSTMDCVVRNLSDDGALLEFPAPVMLPNDFDIELTDRRHRYHAKLRWQDGRRVGVAFEAPPAA